MTNKNDMSLGNLTMFDFSPDKVQESIARTEAVKQVYKDKYGDNWREKWLDHICGRDLGYDATMKEINTDIYYTGRSCTRIETHMSGFSDGKEQFLAKFDKRLHDVYGGRYDELKNNRVNKDLRVANLLIEDAIKTGKWQELPDELQDEYKRRAGNVV